MIFQNVATYSYICTYVLNAQPCIVWEGKMFIEYTFTLKSFPALTLALSFITGSIFLKILALKRVSFQLIFFDFITKFEISHTI